MPSVAVIGASADRSKYGNKAVRAYLRRGWTVYPIHPSLQQVEGLRALRSVRDIGGKVQRIAIYLPPETGITVLDDIAATPHDEFFVNPGAESGEFLAAARALGLQPLQTCAILEVGESPGAY